MALFGKGKQPNIEEVEELFSTVDETGHTNADAARAERERRARGALAVEVDPLSEDDPSGSNVEQYFNRAAAIVVGGALAMILLAQASCGIMRRASTASLAEEATVTTVTAALKMGVEWGDGFTQFPGDFTVREADENTGRIEVSVVDTASADVLECFSSSQIQATAFSINALLNPNINVVVYNVSVHVDKDGDFQGPGLFGLSKPTGEVRTFMTYVWTKHSTESGVRFSCTIAGVDDKTAEELRGKVGSTRIFPSVGGSDEDDEPVEFVVEGEQAVQEEAGQAAEGSADQS